MMPMATPQITARNSTCGMLPDRMGSTRFTGTRDKMRSRSVGAEENTSDAVPSEGLTESRRVNAGTASAKPTRIAMNVVSE